MDPEPAVKADPRRGLPQLGALQQQLEREHPELEPWLIRHAARRTIEAARAALSRGESAGDPKQASLALARRLARPHPRRVVNGTGVVLHTNLGRAPLSPEAVEAVTAAAASYSDLELDLETGSRGNRLGLLGELLCAATGAPAATAVNNNASAMLLIVNTLARGREVVVSRGELVEIGGSFRVPEILERAGVRLVEVGTTNRTHPRDYEDAIGPETGLLLKVHRSNFSQQGFVREVSLRELVAIGRERGIPVVEDLGSGTLVDWRSRGLPEETFVPERLSGVHALCFSGDKLLGGPQAGILLGDPETIAAARRNPLARALRLDKFSIAALDATLRAYLEGRAPAEVPVLRQLAVDVGELAQRAEKLCERLASCAQGALEVRVEEDRSPVGGGSVPGFSLETRVVALRSPSAAERLARGLREAPVPVLTRIRDGDVTIDVRTLLPGDEDACVAALRHWLAEGASPPFTALRSSEHAE